MGAAAVCRGLYRYIEEAVTWKGFCNSSLEAELLTLKIALKWIKEREWKECILATYCQQAIAELKDENKLNTCLTTTILIECRGRTTLIYEGRQANTLADALAKNSRKNKMRTNQIEIILVPLLFCLELILKDINVCNSNSSILSGTNSPAVRGNNVANQLFIN